MLGAIRGWGGRVEEDALLASRAALRGPDEVGHREDEQDDRGPHVEPQAEDVVHLYVVDADVFDQATSQGVAGDVERHHPTEAELELGIGPEKEPANAQVPHATVEERGVDG